MCEPVDIEPHGLTDFDRQVDEIRPGIEAITEAELQAALEAK